jgi:hypothetical protein
MATDLANAGRMAQFRSGADQAAAATPAPPTAGPARPASAPMPAFDLMCAVIRRRLPRLFRRSRGPSKMKPAAFAYRRLVDFDSPLAQ